MNNIPEKRVVPDRRQASRRNTWLVPDWRTAYKWLSIQFTALLAIFTAAMGAVYELLPGAQAYIPQKYYHILMIAGLIAVIIGRVKNQNETKN